MRGPIEGARATRAPRSQSRLWLVATMVGAAGCSSPVETPANVQCGEGTTLVDDTCVAIDGSVGDVATDDTRRAEDAADGTVPSDGGVDGTPPDSSVGDSAGDTPPEVAGDSAIGGDADVAVEIGVEVGKDAAEVGIDALAADPCPATTPDVDCSGMCGGPSTLCVPPHTCDPTEAYPPVLINSFAQLPFTIRMPDHPGVDPKCQPRCGAGNIVWGFALRLNLPYAAGDGIKVTVGPGWKVYSFDPYHPFCFFLPGYGQQCHVYTVANFSVFIGTTDPNAVSRNVLIEQVPSGGLKCP
jgi:hypothetical protein